MFGSTRVSREIGDCKMYLQFLDMADVFESDVEDDDSSSHSKRRVAWDFTTNNVSVMSVCPVCQMNGKKVTYHHV